MTFTLQPPPPPPQKQSKGLIVAVAILGVLLTLALVGVAVVATMWLMGGQSDEARHKPADNSAQTTRHKNSSVQPKKTQAPKNAIRSFDFNDATWPSWVRSGGHASRFTGSVTLHNGRMDQGGNPPHCFVYDTSIPAVYTDLNGDGYEDAVLAYNGTRNPGCAMGDKAYRYVIVWLWDPQKNKPKFIDEPLIDIHYNAISSLSLEAVPKGVKVSVSMGGVGYDTTVAVKNGFIVAVDGYSAGGWGGSCFMGNGTLADAGISRNSSITVSPKPGAPAISVPATGDISPGVLEPGQKVPVKDDGRVMVYIPRSDGGGTCGWMAQ